VSSSRTLGTGLLSARAVCKTILESHLVTSRIRRKFEEALGFGARLPPLRPTGGRGPPGGHWQPPLPRF
jgi:hypothetical protein